MIGNAEIIAIGDELLYGQTLDTNSHWISGKLDAINIKVIQRTTIGDQEAQILQAFREAASRANVILITGGLGPTNDDLTKPLLAKFFNVGMTLNSEAFDEISALLARAGREMSDLIRIQAELPDNCIKITNRMGTAPGMWFEENGVIFISMPGVPYEMKTMMDEIILPRLQEKFHTGVIKHKIIKTIGIPESKLATKIEIWENKLPKHIKLAYLPSLGQVKLRLTASGISTIDLDREIDQLVDELIPVIDKYVYGFDQDEIEAVIGKMLLNNQHTLAVAESCTGGYLSHMITSIPGSSSYFLGSVIAYANAIKIQELKVAPELIEKHGAVSEAVAKSMAEGVRLKFGTTVGLSTTGIAGPDGGTADKPVGTVWIGYSDGKNTFAKQMNFTKDRVINIQFTALAALNQFRLNYLAN